MRGLTIPLALTLARDDGVACRFAADEEGEVTVRDETAELVFPSSDTELWAGLNWCDNPSDPKQDKLQHGCASVYSLLTPATFPPNGRRLAYLPLTVRFADDADVRPERWRRTVIEVNAGERLSAKLASGGGWTARLTPRTMRQDEKTIPND